MVNIGHALRLAAVVLAISTAGCNSGSDLASRSAGRPVAATPSSGGTVHVMMQSLDFSPLAVTAKVGQDVVWTNNDAAAHNVTYVSGPRFNSSPTLTHGKQFSVRLEEPGTIRYVCTLHPWMKATIVVSR
jgi:plastocyanin